MIKWRSMLLGGVISAACIFLLLNNVDLIKTRDSFGEAEPIWLLSSLAFVAAALIVRCWRWQVLFLPDHRVRLWGTISSTMIGYMFNSVLPGRVGELARASLVSQTEHVSTGRALGTILVEKILDVLVLLLALGALTALLPLPPWVAAAGVSASVTFGMVAVVFFVLSNFRLPFVAWTERHLNGLPMLGRLHPSQTADLVLRSADSLRRPHLLLFQLAISVVLWLLALITVAIIMRAFHLNAPWTAAALVLVMTNLGMTVPSAPAYVGVYHYIVVQCLGFFGVDGALALSFAVTLHAIGFGAFIIGGALLLMSGLAGQRYQVSDLWRWRMAGDER